MNFLNEIDLRFYWVIFTYYFFFLQFYALWNNKVSTLKKTSLEVIGIAVLTIAAATDCWVGCAQECHKDRWAINFLTTPPSRRDLGIFRTWGQTSTMGILGIWEICQFFNGCHPLFQMQFSIYDLYQRSRNFIVGKL